ncbi:MAG: hypothetical protein JSV95_06290 [Gemmatimonadota bacterium]|nr:MAG: hypothetical protein JSV95_06290 [Gemmatimonadota bacterium]
MGGPAVRRVRTVFSRAAVESPRGSFETVLYSARDGRVRMFQTTGFEAGLHPTGDWIVLSPEEGRRPLPAGLRQILIGHELHMIFLDPESRFSDPVEESRTTLRDREVIPVRMADEEGRSVHLYYDVQDTLPVGMMLPTALDTVRVGVGEWRPTGALLLFWEAEFRDGSGVYEYEYEELRLDGLPDDLFLPQGGEQDASGGKAEGPARGGM